MPHHAITGAQKRRLCKELPETGIRLRELVDLDIFGLAFLVEAGYFNEFM